MAFFPSGVDLYGGTRHSTVTALGEYFTRDELRESGTFHASEAFERYFQVKRDMSIKIYRQAAEMKSDGQVVELKRRKADPLMIHLFISTRIKNMLLLHHKSGAEGRT